MTTDITRDDELLLGDFCNRSDGGKHWTEVYDLDWCERMEQAGLLVIHRPVHGPTGIPYSHEYWSAEVSEEVLSWFDD